MPVCNDGIPCTHLIHISSVHFTGFQCDKYDCFLDYDYEFDSKVLFVYPCENCINENWAAEASE